MVQSFGKKKYGVDGGCIKAKKNMG